MRARAALVALVCLGCDPVPPRSQIVVVVDSDLVVPEELDTVTLEIQRPSRPTQGPFVQLVDPAKRLAVPLPLTVTLVDREPTDEPVTIVVRGVRRADERLVHVARTRFVEHEIRALCVRLERACVDVACAQGQTCERGVCREAERPAATLPAYSDELVGACRPVVLDAGTPVDAGMPIDAEGAEATMEGGAEPLDGGAR